MLKFGAKKRSREGTRKEYERRVDIGRESVNMFDDDNDGSLDTLLAGMNQRA